MTKPKKPNHIEIPPVPREAIAAVRGRRIFWNCCGGGLRCPLHEPINVGRMRDGPMPPNQV